MTRVWIRGQETDRCFSGETGMCVHISLIFFFFYKMFVFAKTFLGGDHAPWQCVICAEMLAPAFRSTYHIFPLEEETIALIS